MIDIKKLDDTVKLIGLSGPARSGKNTVAQIVATLFAESTSEEAFDWIISSESFASPIKSMVAMMLDFFGVASIMNREQMNEYLEGQSKEVVVPQIGMSPRQLMQTLGTDWGRVIVNNDLWLNSMAHRLPQYEEAAKHGHKGAVVVVTDVRFDNEAEVIKKLGGTMVYITTGDRKLSDNVSFHKSEEGVSKKYFDIILDNSKDEEALIPAVQALVETVCGFALEDKDGAPQLGIASGEIVGTPSVIQGEGKADD